MANRRILLVEGVDDEHVMKHICGNHGIPELDEVKQHGGGSQSPRECPGQNQASTPVSQSPMSRTSSVQTACAIGYSR